MLSTFVIVSQVVAMAIGFLVPWLRARAASAWEEWWLRHMADPPEEAAAERRSHAATAEHSRSVSVAATMDSSRDSCAAPKTVVTDSAFSASDGTTTESRGITSTRTEGEPPEDDGFFRRLDHHIKGNKLATFGFRLVRGLLCPCGSCRAYTNKNVQKMTVYEEQAKLVKFDQASGLSGVITKYMVRDAAPLPAMDDVATEGVTTAWH